MGVCSIKRFGVLSDDKYIWLYYKNINSWLYLTKNPDLLNGNPDSPFTWSPINHGYWKTFRFCVSGGNQLLTLERTNRLCHLHLNCLRNISKGWTIPIRNWSEAINQFAIIFEGRVADGRAQIKITYTQFHLVFHLNDSVMMLSFNYKEPKHQTEFPYQQNYWDGTLAPLERNHLLGTVGDCINVLPVNWLCLNLLEVHPAGVLLGALNADVFTALTRLSSLILDAKVDLNCLGVVPRIDRKFLSKVFRQPSPVSRAISSKL